MTTTRGCQVAHSVEDSTSRSPPLTSIVTKSIVLTECAARISSSRRTSAVAVRTVHPSAAVDVARSEALKSLERRGCGSIFAPRHPICEKRFVTESTTECGRADVYVKALPYSPEQPVQHDVLVVLGVGDQHALSSIPPV